MKKYNLRKSNKFFLYLIKIIILLIIFIFILLKNNFLMRCLIILLGQILIELIVIPHYKLHDRLFSRTNIHLLNILYSILITTIFLRKFNKIYTILVIFLDYFVGKFIIALFYDSSCKYFDSLHSIVMIFITIISYPISIQLFK